MNRRLTSLSLTLLLLAVPALATDLELERFSTGLQFFYGESYGSITVRVSGGGEVYEQTFGANESAALMIDGLPDGNYTFEAVVNPVQSVVRGEDIATRSPDRASTWGHFTIEGGAMIEQLEETGTEVPTPTPGAPTKDFVIADDLIVDGSACIGFDCVNGESFGFDTIRLKENNLRIKFDDTSVAAAFPRTDWQLTANDSANGGASKFSIDDISGSRTPFTIEANARSHSLYVDDGGRIGIRTSTPSTEIHVIDGDTPTLRLQQDGSSGFAPQTWDVAGNETNFFIREVTGGSLLPFRIRPTAPTNSIFVDTNGNVGMGTASPAGHLHLFESAAATNLDFDLENAAGQWRLRVNSTGQLNYVDRDNGSTPMRLGNNANTALLEVGVSAADTVDIDGDLVVTGTITPDYVFETGYELPSIEEQAAYMWKNKHLPAIGGAIVEQDGVHKINVAKRADGVLEELEKAHIYIEQLHQRISELENLEERVEALTATLESLTANE